MMLKIKGLNKNFSGFSLKDVSFRLPRGYIMGMIGENGSGKTTIIKCILNMYKSDIGMVSVQGIDMTVMRNAQLFGLASDTFDMEYLKKLMRDFQVDTVKKVKKLSKGMQMKFQVAMALAKKPKLLVLDEPMGNLDERSRNMIKDILMEYVNDGEKSVLISSHLLDELEEMADYILLIHDGKVALCDDRERLCDDYVMVEAVNKESNMNFKWKLKMFTAFNALNIGRDNVSDILYPLVFLWPWAYLFMRHSDAVAEMSIFTTLLFAFMTGIIRIRLPKAVYLCAVDKEWRIGYVKMAFWLRFTIMEEMNIITHIVIGICMNCSVVATLCRIVLSSAAIMLVGYSFIIQIDNRKDKFVNKVADDIYELHSQFRIIGVVLLIMGMIVFGPFDTFGLNLGTIVFTICGVLVIVGLVANHRELYQCLIEQAADYESMMYYQNKYQR